MKQQKDKAKHLHLYLKEDAIEILKREAARLNLTISQLVEHLIEKFLTDDDPYHRLKRINTEIQELKDRLEQLESTRQRLLEEIKDYEDYKKKLQLKREEAVKILANAILSGKDILEIQEYAKTWSNITKVPYYTLIKEAKNKINEK